MTAKALLNTGLVIILIVAPALSATKPQDHQQQGTPQSETGTKSMPASDPCASVATGETGKGDDVSPKSQLSQKGVTVSISPHRERVAVGYSLRLAATVSVTTNTDVEWAVAGPGCSGSACGSIEGGEYLAPSAVPNPPIVKLTATSKADSGASDSTLVCIVQHGPQWNLSSAVGEINTAAIGAAKSAAPITSGTAGKGSVEILSDTQGVDFGPYLQRVMHDVKLNWYAVMPEEAMKPLLMRGTVAMEFVIFKKRSR